MLLTKDDTKTTQNEEFHGFTNNDDFTFSRYSGKYFTQTKS